MFLRQEFRKYLPEVKKESARGRSAQSSRPVPSPRARASRPGHVAVASAVSRPRGSRAVLG